MDVAAYFRSLSAESEALRDRIRQFIDQAHWPTDGEWKETVLRSMIRRSAPASLTVGRGFVVTPERCSTELDLLLYDNTFPVLYKDGDLVICSPAACRGIVEVKTPQTARQFEETVQKLAENAEFIRRSGAGYPLFVGLFVYENGATNPARCLDALSEAAADDSRRIVDHVALGPSDFIKFWWHEPGEGRHRMSYSHWHYYDLNRMAVGYFVHNLLTETCRSPAVRREEGWFPEESKEVHIRARRRFDAA